MVELNINKETKLPLLRCFPFISKESGDTIITGRGTNYQTLRVQKDLGGISVEKNPLLSRGITRVHLMFRKGSDFLCEESVWEKWLPREKKNRHFVEDWVDNGDDVSVIFMKHLGHMQIQSKENILSRPPHESLLTFWCSQHLEMPILSAVTKASSQLLKTW